MTGARRLAVLWAAAGTLAVAAPAGAQEASTETVLVTYATEAGLDRAVADGGSLEDADDGAAEIAGRVAVAELTPAEAAAIAAAPGVLAVEEPLWVEAADQPNDSCYDSTPAPCQPVGAWHVDRIGLPAAWDLSHGAGMIIAIVDGGVDENSPDLVGKVVGEIRTISGAECATHGTHGAALAGAATNNDLLLPGAGWDARILSVQALRDNGGCGGPETAVIAGITAAVDNGADVVNLSLTAPGLSSAMRAAIDSAVAQGVVVVAAAGNGDENGNGVSNPNLGKGGWPAAYGPVIAVGATTTLDTRAGFSNFGSWVDVFAPGASLQDPQGLGTISGTSFSAPVVAGIVALMRSVRPNLTPAQVSDILVRSADPVNGLRRVDARGALYDTVFGAVPANGIGVHATNGTTIEVMSRSNDGRPLVRTLSTVGPSTRWQQTDGVLLGNPDMTSRAAGRLDVAARGIDGTIYYRARVNGTWGAWASLGGVATSDPAIVSSEPGRVDFFARGLDNALWQSVMVGNAFSGWFSLGGILTSEPDATSWAPGRLDVFARGGDGAIYHRAFASGQWQPWEGLGGAATSGPGAVAWGPNRADVVAAGLDGQLWHKAWLGTRWSEWVPRGGVLASGPEIVSRGPGLLDIFVRAGDQQVWQNSFAGSRFSGWFPST